MILKPARNYSLDKLQRSAASLMVVMVLLTFLATNLQAVLWQSSKWLVSTVLPAVVVQLTNEERIENNKVPLKRNAVLDAAAKLKAENMAKNQYFAHYAPDGTTPWHWFDEAGYVYAHAGENLAIHFTDSSEVVEAWMNSPTHRKNIVDGKFTEIGVGTAKGKYEGYNTVYVVQLFGTPAISPVAEQAEVTPAPVVVAQNTAPVVEATTETNEPEVLAVEDSVITPVEEPVSEPSEVAVVLETTPIEELEESLAIEEPVLVASEDVVVVETTLIATSSGLAVASVTELNEGQNQSTIAGIATRPHLVLEVVYALVALVVAGLLIASMVIEARRLHIIQLVYGGGMVAVMAGLLWLHTVLINGAVIV